MQCAGLGLNQVSHSDWSCTLPAIRPLESTHRNDPHTPYDRYDRQTVPDCHVARIRYFPQLPARSSLPQRDAVYSLDPTDDVRRGSPPQPVRAEWLENAQHQLQIDRDRPIIQRKRRNPLVGLPELSGGCGDLLWQKFACPCAVEMRQSPESVKLTELQTK